MMSIFKELNEVKLDVNELEEIPMSQIQQRRILKNVHQKIQSQKRMKRKKKRHFLAMTATFLVTSIITLNVAFPTFAEKLTSIKNIFEIFVNNDRYIFENFEEFSTDIGVTKESNGVSITVTNAVYDKEYITIAYTIKSEKDLGIRPVLRGDLVVNEYGDPYKNGHSQSFIVEKINNNEYAVLSINEVLGSKPDSIQFTWQGKDIIDLSSVNHVSGEWSFAFSLNALESKVTKLDSNNVKTTDTGVEINGVKMTESPISTTIYLSEKVDERLISKEEKELRVALIEYLVSDNLGNKHKFIHYRDIGHSTDFHVNTRSNPRITISEIDEEAEYLEITPIINVYKTTNPSGGALEPIMKPYSIEPIQIPLIK